MLDASTPIKAATRREELSTLPPYCPLKHKFDSLALPSAILADTTGDFEQFLDSVVLRLAARLTPSLDDTPLSQLGTNHATTWRQSTKSLAEVLSTFRDDPLKQAGPCIKPPADRFSTRGTPYLKDHLGGLKSKKKFYTYIHLGKSGPNVPCRIRAHSLMCWLRWGPPTQEDECQACHTCEDATCINPWHLQWGTFEENVDHWREKVFRIRNNKKRALRRAREKLGELWGEVMRWRWQHWGVIRRYRR
jgi:hypothetical protein